MNNIIHDMINVWPLYVLIEKSACTFSSYRVSDVSVYGNHVFQDIFRDKIKSSSLWRWQIIPREDVFSTECMRVFEEKIAGLPGECVMNGRTRARKGRPIRIQSNDVIRDN